MSTQDRFHITVTIDGDPIVEAWDTCSGGETSTEPASKFTGEGFKVYKTRKRTRGEVTVSRVYEFERDHELSRRLANRAGVADMVISKQPLDEDGNAWGTPKVFSGVLKDVNEPDADSDSSDPTDFQLVMTTKAVD